MQECNPEKPSTENSDGNQHNRDEELGTAIGKLEESLEEDKLVQVKQCSDPAASTNIKDSCSVVQKKTVRGIILANPKVGDEQQPSTPRVSHPVTQKKTTRVTFANLEDLDDNRSSTSRTSLSGVYACSERFVNKAFIDELVGAVAAGKLNDVKNIVNKGVTVNFGYRRGWTPLHVAAYKGQLNVVKFLLSKEADINSVNDNQQTPLFVAAYRGQLEVIKYLIDEGASVNFRTSNGKGSLHAATWSRHLKTVEYLLTKGAIVNSHMSNGKTPLHMAAELGELKIVKHLLDTGANINSEDEAGRTPVDFAVAAGKLIVVQYLLARKADADSEDIDR